MVHKILVPPKEPPVVSALLKKRPMQRFTIPGLDWFLDEEPVPPFPFTATFEGYRHRPWLLLQTSGSTGTPKVITIRHGYGTLIDAWYRLDCGNELARRCGSMRIFISFPPFHMAGIIRSLPLNVFLDSTAVLPPSGPLTAELVDNIHQHADVQYSMLPPSVVVALAENEAYLRNLGKLRALNFAGGPLPQETGDKVSKYVDLDISYGSTEMLAPAMLPKNSQFWDYLHFDEKNSGIEFRETHAGLFELTFVRNPRLDLMQAIFITFPNEDEYHTKDLFSRHPVESHLWKYEGRLDDIIILSNGENLNPVEMEGTITSCPVVSGALVVGQGRFQAALLIEATSPPKSPAERQQLMYQIWPFVERANQRCPAYGRIVQDLVTFTTEDKPLPRAGKGTVQRHLGVAAYASEIDNLYAEFEGSRRQIPHSADPVGSQNVHSLLLSYLANEARLPNLTSDQDFFGAGMDSLQVVDMVNKLNASLLGVRIEPRQVYENASIDKLVRLLQSPHHGSVRAKDNDLENWIEMQQTFRNLASALTNLPTSGLLNGNQRDRQQSYTGLVGPDERALPASSRRPHSGWENLFNQAKLRRSVPRQTHQEYAASKDKWFLISMAQPDGGTTAWLQVLACFLININNLGLVNSFGVFQAYYQADILSHKSNSAISWIGSVQGALLLIVGILSGALFDKGYYRVMLACAAVTLVFALMMLSLAREYYQIMLAQGILVGVCLGFLYVPSLALIPLYFRRRRGLALGLATSGAPVGGIIYPLVFRRVLDELGFGWATRVIGFMVAATLLLAFVLVRPLDYDWTKKPSRKLLDLPALKEIPFFTFILYAFFLFCATLIPFFMTPLFALTALDDAPGPNLALDLVAVVNAGQFFGRIVPAAISDHIGGEIMMFGASAVASILGFCWIAVHTLGGFVVFLLLFGFTSGMLSTLPAMVVPYVCPSLAVLGTRVGMIYGAAGVGTLVGIPVAMAAVTMDTKGQRDGSHFLGAQLWTGLCLVVATALFTIPCAAAFRQRRAMRVDPQTEKARREVMRGYLRNAK